MIKVFFHNLSRPFFTYAPEAFDFDQNAFLLAEAGDIVVTRNKLLSPLYHDFLRTIGVVKEGVQHLHADISGDEKAGYEDLALNESVKRTLPEVVVKLDVFETTDLEYKWARCLNLCLEMSPEQADQFRRKSTFKRLAREAGCITPKYVSNLRSYASVLLAVAWLILLGSKKMVVKFDRGGRGVGNFLIDRGYFFRPSGWRSLRDRLAEFDGRLDHDLLGPRLLEEWINNAHVSPSVQFFINQHGSVEHVSTHVQILAKDFGYGGCYSSQKLSKDDHERLVEEGSRLAATYARSGYRGPLAFDTVISDVGKISWIEANTHQVMTSYAFMIAARAVGGKDPVYASFELVAPVELRLSVDKLMERLRPLLYGCGPAVGIIPYNLALLPVNGNFSVAVIGNDFDEIERYRSDMGKLLQGQGVDKV